MQPKKIVILGGGTAGLYIAQTLEKKLKPGEADVTLVDIRAQMCYQPFLAEVASGCIESRHIQVSLRAHLPKTRVVEAKAKIIDPVRRVVTVGKRGETWEIPYDELVVTIGNVTKTYPIPGLAENAVGLKSTEEAVHIRNTIVENMSIADSLPKGSAQRARLLTFVVVGGGFSGVEGFAEMLDLGRKLLRVHPTIEPCELQFHLIEATGRILPEIPEKDSAWVAAKLEERGGHVHFKTVVESAVDGVVKTPAGDVWPTDLLVWTAGVTACPVLRDSDLPIDARGRLRVLTDLRVSGDEGVVEHVWACGDATACEDLSGGGMPDGTCAPTAQHALRQAKVLARNLLATLHGGKLEDYFHKNAGCVAGLGTGLGVFASGGKGLIIRGRLAHLMHRGYHGLAMPTWERKLRILGDWIGGFVFGKDVSSTIELERPHALLRKFAVVAPEDAARSRKAS